MKLLAFTFVVLFGALSFAQAATDTKAPATEETTAPNQLLADESSSDASKEDATKEDKKAN
jgi:hypothetical protein